MEDYQAVVRLWSVYQGMHRRCSEAGSKRYADYGGRGVYVSDAWAEFNPFCHWALQHGYDYGLQLDRRDNDGPYSPENCQWITPASNALNKRSNRHLTAFGETRTLSEWARDSRCVVSAHVLSYRARSGSWEDEAAITIPSTRSARTCINGHPRKGNTVVRASTGQRYCKRCAAERSSERYYATRQVSKPRKNKARGLE